MKLSNLFIPLVFISLAACASIETTDDHAREPVASERLTLKERLEMAAAYENHGLADKAIVEYKAALLLDPAEIKALTSLVRLSSARQRYDEAETYCRKALELDPKQPAMLNYLGWILAKGRKDYAAAHAAVDGAIASESDQKPFFVESKGIIFMEEGRYEEAIKTLQSALNEAAGAQMGNKSRAMLDIDIYKNMGRAYRKLGKEQEARDALKKAVDLANATGISLKAD